MYVHFGNCDSIMQLKLHIHVLTEIQTRTTINDI